MGSREVFGGLVVWFGLVWWLWLWWWWWCVLGFNGER